MSPPRMKQALTGRQVIAGQFHCRILRGFRESAPERGTRSKGRFGIVNNCDKCLRSLIAS